MVKSNKRATIFFEPLILLGLIVALSIAAISVSQKRSSFGTIGRPAADLLNYNDFGEELLFKVEQAARFAVRDALYELGANGWSAEGPNLGCDSQPIGKPLLIESFPTPQEIVEELTKISDRKLRAYSLRASQLLGLGRLGFHLPTGIEYEWFVEHSGGLLRVSGIADKPVTFSFSSYEVGKPTLYGQPLPLPTASVVFIPLERPKQPEALLLLYGNYSIRPSFTVWIDYDLFGVYERIKEGVEQLKTIIQENRALGFEVTDLALKNKVKELNSAQGELVWQVPKRTSEDPAIYSFVISHKKQLLGCSQPIQIRFAMRIPLAA